MSIEATPPPEQLTTLRSNAIGLPGVFLLLAEHRSEFNVWRHVILPAIPFVLLGIVIYFQFVPLPGSPFNMVGPIDAAWLVLGIIVVVFLNVRAPQVLHQGTRLFAEEPEAVKETA